jgi:hypothetical protein
MMCRRVDFAAAGWSYQRDELALPDRKRDVLECGTTMGREPLFKPVDQEIVCHLQLLDVARQVCSREEGGNNWKYNQILCQRVGNSQHWGASVDWVRATVGCARIEHLPAPCAFQHSHLPVTAEL